MTKVKSITNNIIKNNHTRAIIFKALIFSLILLAIAYVYIILSITFNVIARKSLENRIQIFSSNISKLELTYLSGMNKIDKNYVTSNGFVDISNNIFAIRSTNSVAIR